MSHFTDACWHQQSTKHSSPFKTHDMPMRYALTRLPLQIIWICHMSRGCLLSFHCVLSCAANSSIEERKKIRTNVYDITAETTVLCTQNICRKKQNYNFRLVDRLLRDVLSSVCRTELIYCFSAIGSFCYDDEP